MIDYDKNKERFDRYIERCKKIVETRLFSENELKEGIKTKNIEIKNGLATPEDDLTRVLREHRKRLIDIKVNHTMRIVEDVTKIANSVGAPIDFLKTVKVAALLHDIARFKQAILNDSYDEIRGTDKKTKTIGLEGEYHAQYGKKLLSDYHMFDFFDVPEKYRFAIGEVVYHHQDDVLTKSGYVDKFTNSKQLDTENFLSGTNMLNEQEKIIVAALLQMVRDVDMLDILYQNLSGEMPIMLKTISYKTTNEKTNKKDSLKEIANHWGIDPKIIMEENHLKSDDLSDIDTLSIPVFAIPTIKLQVPLDIQKRFFNNENIDLKEIRNRRDWTFITGMWWRLNHFLNNISFLTNLEMIEQKKVLDQIYATYPDEYKPLVFPAFEFAKEQLVEKVIKENEGEVYIKR